LAAPVASGWSARRVGLAPTGKRRLVTAHTRSRPLRRLDNTGDRTKHVTAHDAFIHLGPTSLPDREHLKRNVYCRATPSCGIRAHRDANRGEEPERNQRSPNSVSRLLLQAGRVTENLRDDMPLPQKSTFPDSVTFRSSPRHLTLSFLTPSVQSGKANQF
jgi:hypothetical protein